MPKESKRIQNVPKDSKIFQKILRKASIAAKHSIVLARWPKKLMVHSPHPFEFKELIAPALLGRVKRKQDARESDAKEQKEMPRNALPF